MRVVLFVKLQEGLTLDTGLIERVKKQIRDNTTPRHVPAKVVQVQDIPRTKSGKIVELAVRNVVHDQPVKNVEALANPEALEFFRNRPELADEAAPREPCGKYYCLTLLMLIVNISHDDQGFQVQGYAGALPRRTHSSLGKHRAAGPSQT